MIPEACTHSGIAPPLGVVELHLLHKLVEAYTCNNELTGACRPRVNDEAAGSDLREATKKAVVHVNHALVPV